MNYHAALAHFPKITYSRYKKLFGYFSNLANLWEAELDDLVKAGLEDNIAYEFIIWREENPVAQIEERLFFAKIQTVSLGEPRYPYLLSQIADPPHTIFVRGHLPAKETPLVAVVGTRRHSTYAKQICGDLVRPLASQGIAIVSGLALGIDGIAHNETLSVGGITVAVLGSGIDKDNIYPPARKHLAERIIDSGGAVISEYPPNFLPTQYSFPARNRIIAGLALGTLVIEAPAKSGSLITARCALDYNREVFTVPHPITSLLGIGNNNLIKMGAYLVTEPSDITNVLNLLNLKQETKGDNLQLDSATETAIWSILSREPKHIDSITRESGLDSSAVNSTLILMEIKGLAKNLGGMMYIKNR
jgi:DNA processing protein